MSDVAARVNRLLRRWTVGERAIAVCSIFYAVHDLEIPMSSVGTVERIDGAILAIRWDGHELAVRTSPDSVDPWPMTGGAS